MDHICIFCLIIAGKIPATIIADYDDILVICDAFPKAPTHFLILPKKHITDICALEQTDTPLAGRLLMTAHTLAQNLPEDEKSFRLVINTGAQAGQTVLHLHLHFLAGKKMATL